MIMLGHWRVREYDSAVADGVFGPEPRIELLNGEIYAVSPIGPRHAYVVRRLNKIVWLLQDKFEVGIQDPITLADHGEPEPDLWIARPGLYADEHPRAEDLLLVVEVSVSTLDFDLNTKAPSYLAAGIPEVWVVDVDHRSIHTFKPRNWATVTTGVLIHGPTGFAVDLDELFR